MPVFWLGAVADIVAFFIVVKICELINITFLFFLSGINSVIASSEGFFWFFIAFSPAFKLFLLVFFLADSAMLLRGEANFESLVLGFLREEKSLAVVP